MKYRHLSLIVALTLTLTVSDLSHSASSTPIFIVAGKVTDSNGNNAPNGLIVVVENQTNQLSSEAVIGADGEAGAYSVAFINFEGKSVAATGDNIKVSVKDSSGKVLIAQARQLTDADIISVQLILNLRLTEAAVPAPTPTPTPTPSPQPTPETPKDTVAEIFSVEVKGSPAKAEGKISITLKAEAGGKGAYSIQGIPRSSDIPLKETISGTYVAEFQAFKGDDVSNAIVAISFEDSSGNKATNISQKVTIDTTPPPKPKSLTVIGDSINLNNAFKVVVTAIATPNSEVNVLMTDGIIPLNKTAKANSAGLFDATFDASALKDGVITVSASEVPDSVGNLGEKEQINVIKDTKPVETPDFFLNSATPSQNVEGSKPVVFLVTLLGKSGFDRSVTLLADGLPKGAFATFNPKELKLSSDNPLQGSQLTITGLEGTPEGEFDFTVFAFASGAGSKTISLKLKKQKESAFITLLLSESKVKLTEKMKIQGQIIASNLQGKVPISLTYTPPKGEVVERVVQTDDKLKYQDEIEANSMGSWKISAKWAGDATYKLAQQSDTFEVTKGDSQIQLQPVSSESVKIGSVVKIIGSLQTLITKKPLKGESIQIDVIKPAGTKKVQNATTSEFGNFEFEVLFDSEGTWQIEGLWDGNESYLASKGKAISVSVAKENAKAIIVLGGGSESENPAWNQFAGLANYVYKVFRRRDLTDDDIYYLSPTDKPLASVDSKTSKEALKFAITDWAKKRTSKNVPLFIYLLSHNLDDKFLLEKSADKEVVLTPEDLANWIGFLEKDVEITLMIEACFSGNFITKKRPAGDPILSADNRVIITSASEERQALILRDLSSFSKSFFDQIIRNENLNTAFLRGRTAIKALRSLQSPQLDANGDGKPNDPIRDFPAVESKYIPEFRLYLASVPEIKEVKAIPAELKSGEKSTTIEVKLTGTDIKTVTANVVPPNFDSSRTFKSWDDLKFDEVKFKKVSEGLYRGEYSNFTLPGEYSIVVYAENPDGSAVPTETTVKVSSAPWDVNSDGEVNIFDLVIVASNMGQKGKEGDVNGDGEVNIFDLVTVASHFGEKIASPALKVKEVDYSRYLPELEKAYQLLVSVSMTNPSSEIEMAKGLLERLIAVAKSRVDVRETKLLANYPNPFNPETWMPFQLNRESEVVIRIYSVSGQLVRTIYLGKRDRGYYIQKDKAAYWDGKNGLGESVASGVYFYTLQAGDFLSTRRMLMVK